MMIFDEDNIIILSSCDDIMTLNKSLMVFKSKSNVKSTKKSNLPDT